jgi:hypothetical protein
MRSSTSDLCQNLTHAPQQIRCLFNHLVETRKQGRWNFKAERPKPGKPPAVGVGGSFPVAFGNFSARLRTERSRQYANHGRSVHHARLHEVLCAPSCLRSRFEQQRDQVPGKSRVKSHGCTAAVARAGSARSRPRLTLKFGSLHCYSEMGLVIKWHKHGTVVYAPARRPRRDIRSPPCQVPGVRCSARDTAMVAMSVPIKSNPPMGAFIFV